jgi:hypothetical protein
MCASTQQRRGDLCTHHITIGEEASGSQQHRATRTTDQMQQSNQRRQTMTTTRNLVLAAATLLTLGTTALSSTEASAYGFRHGFYHHYHSHFGYRHWSYRYHWHYRNFAWRSHYRYRYSYGWPARPHYWRPAVYGAPVGYGAPAPAMAAAPSRPPCLAKQYTPEGAVVFTDRCTQESAVTPPPGADVQPGGQPPQQQ